jgi:hypothetical protein
MLTFGGPQMSFRISNSLWLDFYSRLVRKREQGRVWFGENLISGESSKISITSDGLCLSVSIFEAVEGDEILRRFNKEVMQQYEMHGLKCEDGVWSARFPFSVPIERGSYDEANFRELLTHVQYIRQVEGLVENGRMATDTASQFLQQSLDAIGYINRLAQR